MIDLRSNGRRLTGLNDNHSPFPSCRQTDAFSWIAYTSDRGGTYDIWRVRPNGYAERLTAGLAAGHSVPYWSPDGRRIAFVGAAGIVIALDTRTGAVSRIDQLAPYTQLDWSPDGTHLAYAKDGRIVLYNVLTHANWFVAAPGAADPQWFPSGTELLYSAPDSSGNTQLYLVRSDGTNRQRLTNRTEGPLHDLRLSPNGRYALFTSPGASISLITTVDLATGQTFGLEGGPQAKNYYPAWSPDSGTVAYSATTLEQNRYASDIQTDRRTGGARRTVAASGCFATPVSWSPDGGRLAYLSGCGTGTPATELWTVDIASGSRMRLAEGGRITALEWSPAPAIPGGGRTAVFASDTYRVSFRYPANWRAVSTERYEGADGFFQVSAIASDAPLGAVCRAEAHHPLRPYGSNPRIVMTRLGGQDACLILPSADQPAEMRGQAAFIAVYPEPVAIGGTTYRYFVLWADRPHIAAIARTLAFRLAARHMQASGGRR